MASVNHLSHFFLNNGEPLPSPARHGGWPRSLHPGRRQVHQLGVGVGRPQHPEPHSPAGHYLPSQCGSGIPPACSLATQWPLPLTSRLAGGSGSPRQGRICMLACVPQEGQRPSEGPVPAMGGLWESLEAKRREMGEPARLLGPSGHGSGEQTEATNCLRPGKVVRTPGVLRFSQVLKTIPHLENGDTGPHIHPRRSRFGRSP